MNEKTGKTPSSLAITEKKPYRPGGCVGIFFQLFDWNKRFAKKNFFSRKLLPPSRTKTSKSFGGDEKMPKSKLHLIADENSGGFPNVKKNGKHFSKGETAQKHEMKAPGLVARLMGLEAMPALNRDKPHKKAPTLASKSDVKDVKMVNFQGGIAGKELDLAKSSSKIEPRPPKIQKIEPYDRRIVTRFGAEALQIKNVLSQSKKHHHHHQKFVSSVKSPRISSARNASRTSRLIGVATKILEPGLQATNRAKYSLSYSSQNETATEGIQIVSPDVLEQSACNVSICNSSIGPTSCKNCGNLLDIVESRAKSEDQPFVIPSSSPNFADSSLQGLEKSWLRPSPTSFDQGKEAIFQRSHDQSLSFTSQEENSVQSSNESNTFRSPLSQEARVQAQWHLTSQSGKSQRNEKSHVAFKLRNQSHNHISLDRDRIPAKAKLNNLQGSKAVSSANAVSGAKDFVALNRSSSSRTQHRVPIKVDSAPFEIERNSCRGRDDSLSQLRSPVRKRRTNSVNGQAETTGFINSGIGKEKNDKCNPVTRREMVHGACSMDRTCVKSRSTSQRTGKGAMDKKGTDIISFAFSSPLKQKHGVSMELKEKRKNSNESFALQRHEILENNNEETSLPKNLPLTGDALSALLEQKLKELTSQEDDERKTGCTLPKRSTAVILQELISALTSGQPNSWNGHLFSSDIGFQTEAKAEGTSVGFANHGNHFSPGSVLEASFSIDSFVSSSLDESLGHRLQPDSMDFSYDEPQPTELDVDLLDSATTLDTEKTVNEMTIDLVNRISAMLHVVSNFGLGLSGDKLIHVKEVILKAELLFGNLTPRDSDWTDDFLLAPYIHDEVETLVAIMQVDFKSVLGIDQLKENNQLRGFLFDCAIECIDSKYGPYCNSGFRPWRSLSYCMNSVKLIRDVADEVKRWINLVGMVPDELIEYEMGYSLGKWTDFDIEAYESGVEMDWDILQNIIDEIVDDLVPPRIAYKPCDLRVYCESC
ncbi:TON1 Recruiting Motif 22 [Hibiscus trionum]|uniref:TON1 Recruiting Motif 22 n=1 Tax=Hibiscus trionum TaxID=183268 RepID=A0A9W7GV36_HIBTR|nr:TON1 Recruiting Motif 22 [Hibiscus trionum]